MRVIGLTGGIASGKSTVARLLAARGAVVVDADLLAREVVEPGMPAFLEIVGTFGSEVVGADGRLDRPALGALVFADEAQRRRLEAITHPRIGALMAERISTGVAAVPPLVVVDIPLLFESRREGMVDGVMVVHVGAETQLRRLLARDRLDPAEARRRLAAQMPIDEKRRRATWVIDNDGSPMSTAAQVGRWWEEVVAGSPGQGGGDIPSSSSATS